MQTPNADPPQSNDPQEPQRIPCSAESRIAPYKSDVPLSELEFEKVRLNDLSTVGFSFWNATWPLYTEVVFPLMDHGGAGVMLADIRKAERIEDHFLVHCQFVRRLSYEPK